MRLETAVKQVREDCEDVRKRLRLEGRKLDNPEDTLRVMQDALALHTEKSRSHADDELAHWFVTNHLLEKLGAEERSVATKLLGSVNYNPPARELESQIAAARLMQFTQQGIGTHKKIIEELKELLSKHDEQVRKLERAKKPYASYERLLHAIKQKLQRLHSLPEFIETSQEIISTYAKDKDKPFYE